MSQSPHDPSSRPCFRLRGASGGFVVVRLTVVSRMVAPAVVRPQIDAWVLPDGRLEEPRVELAPAPLADLGASGMDRQGGAVGPIGRHSIIRICYGYDLTLR